MRVHCLNDSKSGLVLVQVNVGVFWRSILWEKFCCGDANLEVEIIGITSMNRTNMTGLT